MRKFNTLIEALNVAPADRPFVTERVDEEECKTLTFGEFRGLARRQAALLGAHGVIAGDRVIVVMPQDICAMAVFAGAMMLGAVPAFLAYPNFKVESSKYRSGLAGVTANLNAKVVIIDEAFPSDMLGHISLGQQTKLVRATAGAARYHEEEIPDEELLVVDDQSDRLAFIQHSAGTTGLQKGVALTHAAVLRQLAHLTAALKIDADRDRIYSWLPLYHDMGLIACFMLPMVYHLPLVMQSPIDWVMRPETMLHLIAEYGCTLAWMPNFAFQFVPRRTPQSLWDHYDLSSLRALINCSEPVRPSSMQEFQRAFASAGLKSNALQSSYAMAENVFAVTQSDLDRPSGPVCLWADSQQFRANHRIVTVDPGTPGSLSFQSSGQLLPSHELHIASDTGALLEDGQVGEILIRSDGLFEGYYNRSDLTSEAMTDGWYHTGDLGFYLEGELFVVGRKKDLIIVGGENLYPQDIEEIVSNHPAIHDGRVVAMGVYNPELGTDGIVVIAEVERDELLADADKMEQEIRNLVVAGTGVAARRIFLKPPKWIIKSTAGKPSRSASREKLLREHPELITAANDGTRSYA